MRKWCWSSTSPMPHSLQTLSMYIGDAGAAPTYIPLLLVVGTPVLNCLLLSYTYCEITVRVCMCVCVCVRVRVCVCVPVAEATRSLEKTAISGGLHILCRWKELYAYEFSISSPSAAGATFSAAILLPRWTSTRPYHPTTTPPGFSRAGSRTSPPLQPLVARGPVDLACLDSLFYGHGAQLPLTPGFSG